MGSPVFGFKDRLDAVILKGIARERRHSPQKVNSVGLPDPSGSIMLGYVVVPKATIPAARRIKTTVTTESGSYKRTTVLPGVGTASIFRRSQLSQNELMQQIEETGDPVEVEIYNLCPTPVVATGNSSRPGTPVDYNPENYYHAAEDRTHIDEDDPLLFVVQDAWGDFYIVNKCLQDGSSSSTSLSSGSSGSSGGSSSGGSSGSTSDSSGTSTSDSSGSTSSGSGSGDMNHVDVWVGGEFDSATCQFLPCTRRISWPAGIGITLGPEECADA